MHAYWIVYIFLKSMFLTLPSQNETAPSVRETGSDQKQPPPCTLCFYVVIEKRLSGDS